MLLIRRLSVSSYLLKRQIVIELEERALYIHPHALIEKEGKNSGHTIYKTAYFMNKHAEASHTHSRALVLSHTHTAELWYSLTHTAELW